MLEYRYERRYLGPVRAVVLDWAGTTVDHGCLAPAAVFIEVFRRRDVGISMGQARAPMGMHKREHLRAIAAMPEVAERWRQIHGQAIRDEDIEAMYSDFVPLQIDCITRYADLVPGCQETIDVLRKRGIRIGSNTGYNREMMEVLVPAAAERGYAPDCYVCSTDVPTGRPAPWMAFECARRLDVYPPAAVVKVDDTVPGIDEGLNAGMWTIGVAATGNEMGLSRGDLEKLPTAERRARLDAAGRKLAQAGAHYVVPGIANVPACIKDIEARLAAGQSP